MRTDISSTPVQPVTVYRKDYIAPGFWVDTVEMGFDLDPLATHVATRITMRRNHDSSEKDVVLFGEALKLLQLRINGVNVKRSAYTVQNGTLRISNVPDEFTLDIETLIQPAKNTSLSGLYVSNNNFFTQCEAEGFRKITYFPDRPDVMAKYTVMLRGDKKKYPVLLSNGNLVAEGNLPGGRHFAKWEDPFKKPSYLFALVAGKLVCQQEKYKLQSGRKVLLQVWVEAGNLDKTQHAMDSLKNSIRWDEERFGLELDLDRFMIVAVSDFNMGAMENKGLNIFNTKYVLANPSIATDIDYAGIESVVGHEYFHNWTGNRVTCRDWFQLSLKEGLTVFRDQEFSADLVGTPTGRAVKRIEDVRLLRQVQFSEDAGPMAHPVRPDSFVEINNFYTVTIYEKGAEVVRMYYTLLGHEGFRKGMDLYFQRHDGQAVECDDFRAAMADSSGRNLKQFERWYSQAGTPRVKVETSYDKASKTYEMTLSQSCPSTPGQGKKLPFHIPVAVGLLNANGKDIALNLEGQTAPSKATTLVLELTAAKQTFRFTGIAKKPVPSILRNFSAPVVLEYDYTDEELGHLLAHDSDPFSRWEAGQRLAMRRLVKLTKAVLQGEVLELDSMFIEALRATLNDRTLDPSFRELVLTLPSEAMIAEEFKEVNPQAIHQARSFVRSSLTQHLRADLLTAYEENLTPGKYSPDAVSAAKRGLKNLSLSYLLQWPDDATFTLAKTQFDEAQNMTDRLAALTALTNFSGSAKNAKISAQALQKFYRDFKNEALVIDKWFMLQGTACTTDAAKVRELMKHPAFTLSNPNRARSLTFSFCNANPSHFHAADGSGYALWADLVIALNKINPQVAARLARSLDRWRKYPKALQVQMKAALQRVADTSKLSKDVLEVVTKALAS
ncbi:aminopeptidase N [Undibacterium sp.]|uniref:aminopeptidase N n=1 Tax=Undibacterium sp. TaxID=1914977 RepID=UPI00374DDE84